MLLYPNTIISGGADSSGGGHLFDTTVGCLRDCKITQFIINLAISSNPSSRNHCLFGCVNKKLFVLDLRLSSSKLNSLD